jgi:hypothetical protein
VPVSFGQRIVQNEALVIVVLTGLPQLARHAGPGSRERQRADTCADLPHLPRPAKSLGHVNALGFIDSRSDRILAAQLAAAGAPWLLAKPGSL